MVDTADHIYGKMMQNQVYDPIMERYLPELKRRLDAR